MQFGKAVGIGKQSFYEQLEIEMSGVDQAYEHCENVMVENLGYAETKSDMNAFLQKKKPEWKQ